jgi:hypothetical protein
LCWIGAASGGRQEPRQKRRLLNFVLSNCTWEDGEVVTTFSQPFDLLAETNAIAARHGAGNTAKSSKSEIWLHTKDSNSELQPRIKPFPTSAIKKAATRKRLSF